MAFKKPADYEEVKVGGDYRVLPAGGYICTILKVEECKSRTNKDMVKVAFDISEGDFAGYFVDSFNYYKTQAEDPTDVKWPFSGTKWILLLNDEGGTNKDFKAFCTSLEESGTEVWKKDVFDAASLKGAKVGIVFRREEHEYQNATSWRTVPFRFRSVKSIEEGNFTVPEDKPIKRLAFDVDQTDSFAQAEEEIPF